jgi:hypothetical protein
MRKVCGTIVMLSGMLGYTGCKNESLLRPPKNEEVFHVPPAEQRYVDAPQIPKEYLNQDPGNPYKNGAPGMPGGGSTPGGLARPGSRPGMYQ